MRESFKARIKRGFSVLLVLLMIFTLFPASVSATSLKERLKMMEVIELEPETVELEPEEAEIELEPEIVELELEEVEIELEPEMTGSELDTVYDDGTVEAFDSSVIATSAMDSAEGRPAYEGTGEWVEPVVPVIPEGTEYMKKPYEESDGPAPRAIFGSDNRTIISNTTANPYRKVCFLTMTFPNGKSYIGSGNLISANMVLTAGHCIYSKADGGWAKSVAVYPGNNGNSAPYGVAYASQLMSISGWTSSESSQHDIGAIKLDRNIGNTVGWFGVTSTLSNPITISGYHGDLSKRQGTEKGNYTTASTNNVYYMLDTKGGSSGSGVYNNSEQIMAINAYESSSRNFGTRINSDKYSIINTWLGNQPAPTSAPAPTSKPAPTPTPAINIGLSKTSWNPSGEAQSTTVTVTTSQSWDMADSATWITTSKSGNVLTINVTANPNQASRNGAVAVIVGSQSRTIQIVQGGQTAATTFSSGRLGYRPNNQADLNLDSISSFEIPQSYTNRDGNPWFDIFFATGAGAVNASTITSSNNNVAQFRNYDNNIARFNVKGVGSAELTFTNKAGTQTYKKTVVVTGSGNDETLSLSQTSWSPSNSAQSTTASVTTNQSSWSASSNASWLSTSQSGNTLTLNVSSNTSTSSRSGTVTVTAGNQSRTLSVTQSGSVSTNATLNISKTRWNPNRAPQTTTVSFTTNQSGVSVSSNSYWLTYSISGGTITLRVSPNPNANPRTGVVTITAGSVSKTVAVTQYGG